jgi:hypothetical protein
MTDYDGYLHFPGFPPVKGVGEPITAIEAKTRELRQALADVGVVTVNELYQVERFGRSDAVADAADGGKRASRKRRRKLRRQASRRANRA